MSSNAAARWLLFNCRRRPHLLPTAVCVVARLLRCSYFCASPDLTSAVKRDIARVQSLRSDADLLLLSRGATSGEEQIEGKTWAAVTSCNSTRQRVHTTERRGDSAATIQYQTPRTGQLRLRTTMKMEPVAVTHDDDGVGGSSFTIILGQWSWGNRQRLKEGDELKGAELSFNNNTFNK